MAAISRAIRIIPSIANWSRRKQIVARMSEATSGAVSAAFPDVATLFRATRARHVSGRRIRKEKDKSRGARQARRRPMSVRQGRLRDRRAGALGLARSFAVEPPRAWRGLCNLCRELAQAFSYHQGQDQPHVLRGQGYQDGTKLLRELRHAHFI